MNDIDWSKAPEGTKGHAWVGMVSREVWVGKAWYEYCESGKRHYFGSSCTYTREELHNLTHRPLPSPVSVTNAETLPYVGQPVEFLSSDLGEFWCEGKVSYVGPKFIVVTYAHPTAGESEACMNHTIAEPPLSTRIRPVRTPEQKRLDEIDVMCKDCRYDGGGASFYTCAGLYDAGYRKVQP